MEPADHRLTRPIIDCLEVPEKMPIRAKPDLKSATLFVEAKGIINMEERRAALAMFKEQFTTRRFRYGFFDLSELSAENDPHEELAFGKMMVESRSVFEGIRTAVMISKEFLISSAVVLELQKCGVNMVDFTDLREAKEWLYAETP